MRPSAGAAVSATCALVDHFDAWEHLGVGSPQTLPPRHEADPEHEEKEDHLVEGHARARLGITPETRLES
jgi:hypothetical protein